MGRIFSCSCNACGHEFELTQGGGFTFYQVCCDGCGRSRSLPRSSPRTGSGQARPLTHRTTDSDVTSRSEIVSEPMTEDEIKAYLDSRDWSSSGDSWTAAERQILMALLGECECGGHWQDPPEANSYDPHPLHRCPMCRSRDFQSVFTGLFD